MTGARVVWLLGLLLTLSLSLSCETSDPPGSTTSGGLRCIDKEIQFSSDEDQIKFVVDPGDPRWADLYDACASGGHYCRNLCHELSAAIRPDVVVVVEGCRLTCDAFGRTVARVNLAPRGLVF